MTFLNDKKKGPVNRVAIPLQALDLKDTTLQYSQLQTKLSGSLSTLIALKNLNTVLISCTVLVSLYLLIALTKTIFFPMNMDSLNGIRVASVKAKDVVLDKKDYSDFFQLVHKRNIFLPSVYLSENQIKLMDQAKKEVIKKFKIIGIVIDTKPKAILEVLSNNETVFVERGDLVEGALMKEINEEKITIVYKGLELDLIR